MTSGKTPQPAVEQLLDEKVMAIPIEDVHPAADNPRRQLGDLTELVESINQLGVLQPLVVTPRGHDGYTIVFGHRRRAAAELAKVVRIPAIIRTYSETDRVVAMGTENLAREDLTPLEEAAFYASLTRAPHKLSQRDIAARVGVSQATVSKRVSLLLLPEQVHEAIDQGRITLDEAAKLATLAGEAGFEAAVAHEVKINRGWLYDHVKSAIEEQAAQGRRKKTRAGLEKEGKRILGEAQRSWNAGPGYPARTLDAVVQSAGKNFDPAKHGALKCAGWFITYDGEAVEACDDWTKHQAGGSKAEREDDRALELRRKEMEKRVGLAKEAAEARRAFFTKKLIPAPPSDAKDYVVAMSLVAEPYWDDDGDLLELLGFEVPARADYDWAHGQLWQIAAGGDARTLQAAYAKALIQGELAVGIHRDDPLEADAPGRSYLAHLARHGYVFREAELFVTGQEQSEGSVVDGVQHGEIDGVATTITRFVPENAADDLPELTPCPVCKRTGCAHTAAEKDAARVKAGVA